MAANLDNVTRIKRIDASDMIGAIGRFPDYFSEATQRSQPGDLVSREKRPRSLVMMGMGGSACAADVVMDWLRSEMRIPGMVLREPSLPAFVDSSTLFIAISYSGRTSETLAALKEAKRRASILVGIGSGGRLESMCRRFHVPFVTVPTSIAPRAALGQMVVATANILERFELVHHISREMLAAGKELALLRNRLRREVPLKENPSKRIAVKLLGQLVAVYSLSRMSSVGRRFKNQLSENSKVQAKCDILPESGHNEVEAWRRQRLPVTPLIIRDSKESSPETSFIRAFISTIHARSRVDPVEVRLDGHTMLSRLLLPIFFLDYASVYLAILKGIDPTPTPLIADLKRLLD